MSSRFMVRLSAVAWVLAVGLVSFPRVAAAQSTIKQPGERPHYAFELEPHVIATPFDAPDFPADGGYGLGVRGTIELVRNGFVPQINNSVGIGFGLDWVHYDATPYRGGCARFVSTAGGVPVCVDAGGGGGSGANYVYVPVVMQWNFWLHRRWSVFGEPGLAFSHHSGGSLGVEPDFAAGGRFHVTDGVTLTLRLGYPATTFGVSFLL